MHAAGITGENLVPLLESRIAWNQVVPRIRVAAIEPYRVDITRYILRMVKDIAEVSPELDLLILAANIEDLRERHIEVVGWIRGQCIPASGSESAETGLDVHRGRIFRKVS